MILVAGSANLDFIVRAHHIAQAGETVLGHGFQTFPGGKGANQALPAARAGGALTQMLLALGADAFATPIELSLRQAQVDLCVVRVANQATGVAFISVADDGENAITVAPGANTALLPTHLPPLRGISHLLLQLETPIATVTAYARAACAQGVAVVLNAAPAQALPVELLQLVDVLVVNEGELAIVAQHCGIELGKHLGEELGSEADAHAITDAGALAQCLQSIAVPTVVVTLGQRGCCAHHQGKFFYQNAYAVHAVDTTGAGDTFCGVLVASLSQGADMGQALRWHAPSWARKAAFPRPPK